MHYTGAKPLIFFGSNLVVICSLLSEQSNLQVRAVEQLPARERQHLRPGRELRQHRYTKEPHLPPSDFLTAQSTRANSGPGEEGSMDCGSLLQRGADAYRNQSAIRNATLSNLESGFLLTMTVHDDKGLSTIGLELYGDLVVKSAWSDDPPDSGGRWNLTAYNKEPIGIGSSGRFDFEMMVSTRSYCRFTGTVTFSEDTKSRLFDGNGACQESRRQSEVATSLPPSIYKTLARQRQKQADGACKEIYDKERSLDQLKLSENGEWRKYGTIYIPWSRWKQVLPGKRSTGFLIAPEASQEGRNIDKQIGRIRKEPEYPVPLSTLHDVPGGVDILEAWGGLAKAMQLLGRSATYRLLPHWISVSCRTGTYSVNYAPRNYALAIKRSGLPAIVAEHLIWFESMPGFEKIYRHAPFIHPSAWSAWEVPGHGSDWEKVVIDLCSNIASP